MRLLYRDILEDAVEVYKRDVVEYASSVLHASSSRFHRVVLDQILCLSSTSFRMRIWQRERVSLLLFFSALKSRWKLTCCSGQSSCVLPSSYRFSGHTSGFFCHGAKRILKVTKIPVYVTVICNPSKGHSLTLTRWTR